MKVYYVAGIPYSDELYHHGIKGQKWGVRRFQNEDGSLTNAGEKRYLSQDEYRSEISNHVKEAIRTGDQSYFGRGGTVDLDRRPVVPSEWLREMGYDAEPGGVATVFSHSTSIGDNGEHAVTVTPILPNGDVLEPRTMDAVLDNIYLGNDGKPHLDGNDWGFRLEDILVSHYDVSNIPPENRSDYINTMANSLHEVQEALYEGAEPIEEPTDDIPSIKAKKKVKNGKNYIDKAAGIAMSAVKASASIISSGLNFIKNLFSH